MTIRPSRPFGQNYAFVVVAVIFLALLSSAGMRATPGVLMLPLSQAFGWSRADISAAAAVGILLYGLIGPFAAALMQHFGIRRTLMGALLLMAASAAASYGMTQPWQLMLTWGILSGAGTGCVAVVLGATVVSRWFHTNRGTIMGLLTASTATGTLIFLPLLAAIAQAGGWQPVVLTIAACCAALIPLVFWLVPERPSDIGLKRFGAASIDIHDPNAPRPNLVALTLGTLKRASGHKVFWYLFATFFVCGFTTNGLIGTHFISICSDHAIPEVRAAGYLAVMGIFDLFGTTASGWLTDRYDPRKLLFMYYGLRGLSLIYLPYSDFSFYSLTLFGIFYGLDWIATVPPTLRLANEAFGEKDAPIIFGWIVAGHQVGAATATFMAGVMRAHQGSYLEPLVIAGAMGVIAAVLALLVPRRSVSSPVKSASA